MPIQVEWSKGYQNSYRKKDLVLVHRKEKDVEEIKETLKEVYSLLTLDEEDFSEKLECLIAAHKQKEL